jgi:hypothetical protein
MRVSVCVQFAQVLTLLPSTVQVGSVQEGNECPSAQGSVVPLSQAVRVNTNTIIAIMAAMSHKFLLFFIENSLIILGFLKLKFSKTI